MIPDLSLAHSVALMVTLRVARVEVVAWVLVVVEAAHLLMVVICIDKQIETIA